MAITMRKKIKIDTEVHSADYKELMLNNRNFERVISDKIEAEAIILKKSMVTKEPESNNWPINKFQTTNNIRRRVSFDDNLPMHISEVSEELDVDTNSVSEISKTKSKMGVSHVSSLDLSVTEHGSIGRETRPIYNVEDIDATSIGKSPVPNSSVDTKSNQTTKFIKKRNKGSPLVRRLQSMGNAQAA